MIEIITGIINAMLSMFGELIKYLIEAPGNAFRMIMVNWGNSFASYGIVIPIILVLVIGITGMVAYTMIAMSSTMTEGMNATGLIGVS